jgi:uncharacterized membrane protein YkgB
MKCCGAVSPFSLSGTNLPEWRKLMIIQFNSYLFTCELNTSEASYSASNSKKKETTTEYFKQNKTYMVDIVITIIIIQLVKGIVKR